MNPLIINLDVDSTIRNTPQAICDVYRNNFDPTSTLEPKDIFSWNLKKVFPLITSIKDFFMDYSVDLFFNARPYDRAIEVVQRLYEENIINVVTDQPEEKERLTELWSRMHGIPYYEFHCTPHKHLVKADVMIDDKPTVINTYKERHPDSTTILINQPYNNGEGDFQVNPDSLDDIIPIIESLKQKQW